MLNLKKSDERNTWLLHRKAEQGVIIQLKQGMDPTILTFENKPININIKY